MKKITLAIIASSLITSLTFSGCNSAEENKDHAKDNLEQAKTDLVNANEEYEADVAKYKQETAEKIAANDKSIAEFNERIEHEKKEAQADYRAKVKNLEEKNADMKKKMDDYKANGKENWEKFKIEFSHDMDQLGKAFKDLTVKNVK